MNELRTGLATVAEALILFQEFLEAEIGDMSYFWDSGSYCKLVEVFDKVRVQAFKNSSPALEQTISFEKPRQSSSANIDPETPMNLVMKDAEEFDATVEDEEEVEVDVDFNENAEVVGEDSGPFEEVTIKRVYTVSPPSAPVAISSESFGSASNNPLSILAAASATKEAEARQEQQQQHRTKRNKKAKTWSPFPAFTLPNRPSLSIEPQIELPVTSTQGTSAATTSTGIPDLVPFMMPAASSRVKSSPKMKAQTKVAGVKKARTAKATGTGKAVGKTAALKRKAPVAPPKIVARRRKSDRPVKCPVCFKGYSSKGVLSRHVKEAHQTEPQFPCFYCPLKFRNGPTRLDHMHNVHPTDFNSKICPYCERKSSSATGKRNHMMLCARKYQGNFQNVDVGRKRKKLSPTLAAIPMPIPEPAHANGEMMMNEAKIEDRNE